MKHHSKNKFEKLVHLVGFIVRNFFLMFGMVIAVLLCDTHTHLLLCSFLGVWDALHNGMSVSSQYHRSRHPALSDRCYSAVCAWESSQCWLLASVVQMLETDEALCWDHRSETDYVVEEAVLIWRNGHWLVNSSCDDITLFASRRYLGDWPTDWMTDQPAD